MAYEWLLGIGFMFGFALLLSLLSGYSIEKFIGYLALCSAFMVWIEFLPMWIMILNIVALVFIVIGKGKVGGI